MPLYEMVIQKVDFERFIIALTTMEERYVLYKMIDELPDARAAAALSISIEKLHTMRATVRGKIEEHSSD